VTGAVVEQPEGELEKIMAEATALRFEELFREKHEVTLTLEPQARVALMDAARAKGRPADEFGMEWFKDYGHGLKLIHVTELTVPEEAVQNPEGYLDGLIKQFYSRQSRKTE
jgi:hypothetical protein